MESLALKAALILFDEVAEILLLKRISNRNAQALCIKRFLQEIECSGPHGFYRHVDGAVGGDDNDGRILFQLFQFAHQFDTVDVRQIQIKQDNGRIFADNMVQACSAFGYVGYINRQVFQVLHVDLGQRVAVLDKQNL